MSSPPRDRLDIQVFTEIEIIEHLMRRAVSEHLPPGMAYSHFELLMHLVREGDGQTPAELAQAMMMTKGALTNILQRMAEGRLVLVLADVADKRKKRVRLTRQGIEAHKAVLKALKPQTDRLRDGFTEAEFRQALPFLRALRVFLEEVSERPGP
jgi:DNA-binding MarR family transcriptional regulator